MPAEPFVAAKNRASKPAMILRIHRPGGEAPLQFPAVIRNLVNGVATVEVNNPWTEMNWETLKGQGGSLRLLGETGEVTDLQGIINWTLYNVQDHDNGKLSLCLEITDLDPSARKLLAEYIPYTAKDIKGFWDQWDQTQESRAPKLPLVVTKGGLAALGLLFAGLALQFSGPLEFRLFGLLLWCGGTLVIAWQALRFWKNRKASH
ncbi:MAG: hypothetical protein M1438_11695 [Deltaproteobacteria bacterium]|nr:hypothetical protein [Deltaproteobacteria bacterium]